MLLLTGKVYIETVNRLLIFVSPSMHYSGVIIIIIIGVFPGVSSNYVFTDKPSDNNAQTFLLCTLYMLTIFDSSLIGRIMHPKFDPPGVQTYDLWIMNRLCPWNTESSGTYHFHQSSFRKNPFNLVISLSHLLSLQRHQIQTYLVQTLYNYIIYCKCIYVYYIVFYGTWLPK